MPVLHRSQSGERLVLSFGPLSLQEPVYAEAHKGHRGHLVRRIRRKFLLQ
jgi:hypothetical protein